MIAKLKTLRWLALTAGVCLLLSMPPTSVYTQQRDPIAKEGLLRSLRRKVLVSRELVEQVEQRGVDFHLTSTDEKQIRRAGKYLGRQGLDDLITAVRENYRTVVSQRPDAPKTPPARQSESGTEQKIRRLTDAQKTAMVGLLRPHSGQGIILIAAGDDASRFLYHDINDVFTAAGWRIVGGDVPPVRYGITCGVPDPAHISPAVDHIISAFQKADIRVSIDTLSSLPIPTSQRAIYESKGFTIGLSVGSIP